MTSRTMFKRVHRAALAAAAAGTLLVGCGGSGDSLSAGSVVADSSGASPGADLAAFGGSSASAYGSYLAALHATRRNALEDAAGFMADALDRDADSAKLRQRAFLLHASVGEMDAAARLAERLREDGGGQGVAALMDVVRSVRGGDMATAQERVDALPSHGLSALVKPLISGWLAVKRGELEAGLAKLDELDGIQGLGVLRHVHAALMKDVAGNTEAARAAYENAGQAASSLTVRLAWLVGNFYARQGEPERARQVYEKVLQRNADSAIVQLLLERLDARDKAPSAEVATVRHGIAEALFNVAGLLSQERATELALVYTQFALHLRPDYEAGRVLLGEILQSQGRSRAAIETYRAVAPDSPVDFVAKLRVAEELGALGKFDEAEALLREVAEAKPDAYEPLYRLGNALRQQEAFAQAAEVYARAVERVGEPQRRHWTLYYFHGIALERTDRWAEAEERFSTALDLYPEQPYVMNYLAYSWVEQKTNLDRALEMLDTAVSKRPEDGYIVDSLGWAHYRLGNFEKAVKHLERAVELRPGDPTINDHLGDAYWHVGREREARYQWQRALDLGPRDTEAEEIRGKLENGLNAAQATANTNG
ncbi:Tetratricopeptide repeat-containing protein [Limimonas halophila]|uniref:Tetratricopeptide repeat-containing protein n=1 Tax=Limimonas halophila TaxID=1082479 RepID=A0A1G7S2T7_9PROT|nr:tetratricopeptide repeat protein [Limimonas halophila]SDG16749.1 Tetratricopeptide repeat-containing protein [Limimonas halophila]